MNERYPQIRLEMLFEDERIPLLRESVCVAFYLRRSHRDIVQGVRHALEAYLRTLGPQALGCYLDYDGDWNDLDETGWQSIRERLLHPQGVRLRLAEAPRLTGHEFRYQGWNLDGLPLPDRGAVCAVAFWLPTEFLEEHGPERVRELALELARLLPFNSGQAGLCFHVPVWGGRNTPVIREKCARHPGLDIPDLDTLSLELGTRVRGPSWLTFLGQPVLGALGGAAGLRARLRSPGTTVQELDGDRVVVTLGGAPEAGDLEQGDMLPHYRELARVLEPWLYEHQGFWGNLTEAELRRWERRFLD